MKIGRQARGNPERELDHLIAGIQGGWNREHTEDGSHDAITATSIDVQRATLHQPRAILSQLTQEVVNLDTIVFDTAEEVTDVAHVAGSGRITIRTPGLYLITASVFLTENDATLYLSRTRQGTASTIAAGTFVAGVTSPGASVLSTVVPLRAYDVVSLFVVLVAGPSPGTVGYGMAPAFNNAWSLVRVDA